MNNEGLQVCFFCARSTVDFTVTGRADMLRKYLALESVCPECRKHWAPRLKEMEAKRDALLAEAAKKDTGYDYRGKKARK